VIIGGGNAGISLAARLQRYGVKDVAVIEPRDHHLYQPLFSHIAGGRARPAGTAWPWTRPVSMSAIPCCRQPGPGFGHVAAKTT
jgi:NADH dehydrogenase FAD-containing subunit